MLPKPDHPRNYEIRSSEIKIVKKVGYYLLKMLQQSENSSERCACLHFLEGRGCDLVGSFHNGSAALLL